MSFSIEITGNEVTVNNGQDFDILAKFLGVEVKRQGAKPKAALAKAALAKGLTIVETPYFNAGMAQSGNGTSEYGTRLKALKAVRDAAIEAAKVAYTEAETALRTEFNVTATSRKADDAPVYRVTATVPRVKDGAVVLKSDNTVSYQSKRVSVDLTLDEIRANSDMAARGRPSSSNTVRAAAVVGGWLPTDELDRWSSLLKDYSVDRVVMEETVTAE